MARRAATAPRIAIVGAGLAGLVAAYRLQRAGVPARVQVYEAGGRPGGRICTARGLVAPGVLTELGGEFLDSGHGDILALVREFGLSLDDMDDNPRRLVPRTYFFEGVHHTEDQAIAAFRPLAERARAEWAGLEADARFRDHPRFRALDRISVAEYLDRVDARGWLRRLIEVALSAEYGLDCGELSAVNLLSLIGSEVAVDDEAEGVNTLALYGESDERYRVRGGTRQVIDALARRVEALAPIRYEHRLESIRSGVGDGFRLDFAVAGGRGVAVAADLAVLALPFSVLRELELGVALPEAKARSIATLGYGHNAKVVAGMRRRPWRAAGYLGTIFSDELPGTAWDHGRFQAAEASGLTFFCGGRAGAGLGVGTAEEQAARLLSGLDRAFPGVRDAFNGRAGRYHWPSSPLARGSYACYKVGQWSTIAGVEGAPVGNLFFAGEHCNGGHTGFMDSAAASGRRTARALLARLAGR
jgi:monoamine oxidase